jgi:predicted DCC family thiol-disulfide oxidoreductase YuxK
MPVRGEVPTLIFDGDCGLCRRAVALVGSWDREHRLRYVPFQDEEAIREFDIALPALAAAMHLVLPDGRVFAGADAVPELGRLLPGKRWWVWGFAVPGVRRLARRVYARIARGRRCAVRGLPAKPTPEQIGGRRRIV